MKKEYTIPTIEIIAMINEDLLQDSVFDPGNILDGETDDDWFN